MKKSVFCIVTLGIAFYILWDWWSYKTSRLLYFPKNDCVQSTKYKDVALENGWGVYICTKDGKVTTEILMDPKQLERHKYGK